MPKKMKKKLQGRETKNKENKSSNSIYANPVKNFIFTLKSTF